MIKNSILVVAFVALMPLLVSADEKEPEATGTDDAKLTAGPADKLERAKPGPVDADASKEFQTTESGLKYRILRKSKKNKPAATDAVEVHYKGWLDNGKIFDSSYRRGSKIKFGLNQVIPGWTEGMQLVGAGGMIELEIPSKLGYGVRGAPPTIPPNANLHFVVELFDITKLGG